MGDLSPTPGLRAVRDGDQHRYGGPMMKSFANGGAIPMIGMGTWPLDDAQAERAVAEAIGLGYRLVDTAYNYMNEIGVGKGVKASGLPREDIFITTKFNRASHSHAGVAAAWADAARKLDVEYIDLMLIHWPNPDQDRYVEAWEGLITLREQGKVRHIGTSNFLPEHLDRIIAATGVTPDLDQLSVNPRYQQREARDYNDAHGIVTQAWSPLGQGNDLLQQPTIVSLAAEQGITPGELVLGWHMAHGLPTIPKSSNRERLIANLAAQDIVLDPAVVAALDAMDGTDPGAANFHPNVFGH